MAANEKVSLELEIQLDALRKELAETHDMTAREARVMVSQVAVAYRQLAKQVKEQRSEEKADAKAAAAAAGRAAKATIDAEKRILAARRAVMTESEKIADINKQRLLDVERLADAGVEEQKVSELRAAVEAQIAHEAKQRSQAALELAKAEKDAAAAAAQSAQQAEAARQAAELAAAERRSAAIAMKAEAQLQSQLTTLLRARMTDEERIASIAKERLAAVDALVAKGASEEDAARLKAAIEEDLNETLKERQRIAQEKAGGPGTADNAKAAAAALRAEGEVRARILALEREGMSAMQRKIAAINDEIAALSQARQAKVDEQLIEQASMALTAKRDALERQMVEESASRRREALIQRVTEEQEAAKKIEAANQRIADKLAVLTGERGKAEQAAIEANRRELAAVAQLEAASNNSAQAQQLRAATSKAAIERLAAAREKDAAAAAAAASSTVDSAARATEAVSSVAAVTESAAAKAEAAYDRQVAQIKKLAGEGANLAAVQKAYARAEQQRQKALATIRERAIEQQKQAAAEQAKAAAQREAAEQRVSDMIALSSGKRGMAEQKVLEAYRREIVELDKLAEAGAEEAKITELRAQAKQRLAAAKQSAQAVDERTNKLMAQGATRVDAFAQAQREASKVGKGFKSTLGAIAQQAPDVAAQMASGTSAMQILTQQGLQVVQVEMHNLIRVFGMLGAAALPVTAVVAAATFAFVQHKVATEDAKNATDSLERQLGAAAKEFKRIRGEAAQANSEFGKFKKTTQELREDIAVALGKVGEPEIELQRKLRAADDEARNFILHAEQRRANALLRLGKQEQKLSEMRAKRASELEAQDQKALVDADLKVRSTARVVTVTEKMIKAQERTVERTKQQLDQAHLTREERKKELSEQKGLIRVLHDLEQQQDKESGAKDRATESSKRLKDALEAEKDIQEMLDGLQRGRLADRNAFIDARDQELARIEQSFAKEVSLAYGRNASLMNADAELLSQYADHVDQMEDVRERFAVPVQQNPLLSSERNANKKLEELYATRLEAVKKGSAEEEAVMESHARDKARLDEEYALRREVVALKEQRVMDDLVAATREATLEAAGHEEAATRAIYKSWEETYRQLEEAAERRRDAVGENNEQLAVIEDEHQQAIADIQLQYMEQIRIAQEEHAQELAKKQAEAQQEQFRIFTDGAQMMIGGVGSMAANIEEIMANTKSLSKRQALAFFRFQKGVAMAEAIVAGAVAVQRALALGPILGPPAAVVMGAATATQIAAIASATPGGGGGGGGGGRGGSPARASSEMRQQAGFPAHSSAAASTPPPPPPPPGSRTRASYHGPRDSRSTSSARSSGSSSVRAVVRYDHKTHDSFMRDHDRLPGSQHRRGQDESTFIGRERR